MDEPQPSRRQLLLSSGAVLASLGGCLGRTDPTSSEANGPPSDRLQLVPDGATGVAALDAESLLGDEQFRATIEDLANEISAADRNLTVETALNAVQERAGLDPREVTDVLAFGRVGPEPYAGGYVWSNWTDAELTAEFESVGASTRAYGDRTLYERDGLAVVGFGDGEYALGARPAVEDAIDVRNGDVQAVGGDVERAYTAAPEGHIRAGFAVPDDTLRGLTVAGTEIADAVSYGSYSVYPAGDGYGTEFTLRATDGTAAETLAGKLETLLDAASRRLASLEDRPDLRERARQIVETTEVSRDGRAVTLSNASHGATVLAFGLAAAGAFVLNLGSAPAPRPPQVSFGFDYGDQSGLTITHHSGEHVPAAELSIRGEGLSDTGSWVGLGGSTSGEVGEDPAVVAGDRVTVEARPDYRVQVVWESASGERAAVLARAEGPG